MMHGYYGGVHWLWMLLMAVLIIVPVWRICQKAGYSGWLSLLTLVPLLNLGLLYFLAFSEWPAGSAKNPDSPSSEDTSWK